MTNSYFQKLIADTNDNNYVYIHAILDFNMMKKHKATLEDIIQLSQYASNYELDPNKYKIRQKVKVVN